MYCFEIGDAQKSLLFQLKDAFTMKSLENILVSGVWAHVKGTVKINLNHTPKQTYNTTESETLRFVRDTCQIMSVNIMSRARSTALSDFGTLIGLHDQRNLELPFKLVIRNNQSQCRENRIRVWFLTNFGRVAFYTPVVLKRIREWNKTAWLSLVRLNSFSSKRGKVYESIKPNELPLKCKADKLLLN